MGINENKSIRRKLTRRIVVALVITISALSIVNLLYMARRVTEEQYKELELATKLCSNQIDSWIGDMKSITNDTADSLSALETIDKETVETLINKIAYIHGDLYFVYLGTEEGDIYMARGMKQAAGYDPRKRNWYMQAKAAGHTIVTDPYISAARPDVMLATVATPVYFGTTMVGVVAVDTDIATINSYVESIDFKNGAYGFLIDSAGNVAAHENVDFLPTVEKSYSAKEVMPEVCDIIKRPGSEMVNAKDYNGERMVYYTERLKESKWVMGVAYPVSEIMAIIDRGIQICVLIAIICILVAAADMTAAIRKILLPIDRINPAMDKLMEGDFSAQIDITKEEDELGALQNRMKEYIEFMSELIDRQKYVLGEMEKGNLIVEDMSDYPGELNEISKSVNSIKEKFNDIISDIQFSAINLQSFAMGVNADSDYEEMKAVFEELSAEANILMEKTSKFKTMPSLNDIDEGNEI